MKYTANTKKYLGFIDSWKAGICPLDLFDANDKQISGANVEAFDTETGRVWETIKNEKGEYVIDESEGTIASVMKVYPPPLRIHSLTDEEMQSRGYS